MKTNNSIEKPIFFLTEEDVYNGNAPYFFNPKEYAFTVILEQNWKIITEEFSKIITGEESIEISSPNPPYLSNSEAWKNIYFFNFMWKYHNNCKKYPNTYKLLSSIPNLTFAEVTVLEGNSHILPHIGETNVTMRGHLGLKIPGGLPELGIQVGAEKKGWEEGKIVLFSDAHRHHVWNNSNQRRIVLVFDIIKEEYSDRKLWYCSQALSTLVIKAIDAKVSVFKRLPRKMLYCIHLFFSCAWYFYLPIQRSFGFPFRK